MPTPNQLTPEQFAQEYLPAVARSLAEGSLEPALHACGIEIGRSMGLNFTAEASADGGSWPAHAPSTVRRYGPHPLLILSGELFQSVTSNFGGHHVERIGGREMDWGTNLVYAATQNFGDPSRNIPKREFLAADDGTLDACAELIADEMLGQFFKN